MSSRARSMFRWNICLASGVNINGLVHRFKVKWPQKENNLELRVFQIQLDF